MGVNPRRSQIPPLQRRHRAMTPHFAPRPPKRPGTSMHPVYEDPGKTGGSVPPVHQALPD
jgi:hypothetical protein